MTMEPTESPASRDSWAEVRRIWEIIDRLRGANGCPWDRKQTPASVQTYLIEEAHEAAGAIREGKDGEAAEELGDTLFMVFFLIHLYQEQGTWELKDVARRICEKMIRRHPHVFGDTSVNSTKEVRDNWEKIKAGEKAAKGKSPDPVPETLPALMRAYRMLSRIARKDATWNDRENQTRSFAEKARTLTRRLEAGETPAPVEIGELLLLLANLSRLLKYRPEDCLHEALRALD